jgi:hypothetical protein
MVGFSSVQPSYAIGAPRTTDGTITWDLSTDVQKNLTVPQKINRLDPAVVGAPILGFTSRLGGPRTVNNVVFYMLRTRRLRDYITLNGSYTTGTTFTFSAADVALLQVGYHIINLATRELVRVTAIASTTTITVERARGTVASASSDTTTDKFLILGYSGAEADSKFFGLSKFPEVIFNYLGELQDTFSISQWEHDSAKMPGAETPQAKERTDHLQNMRMNLEKRAIFSQRSKMPDENDNAIYLPNGLDAMCTENEQDFGGDITEAKLQSWGETLGRHGPGERLCMASAKFMRKINLTLSGQQYQDTSTLSKAGLAIRSYNAGGVILRFFIHPLFQDDTSTTTDALNGHCYAMDPSNFRMVTMRGKLTGWFRWFMNVQTPGFRGVQDQLVTNYGFWMTMPEHFSRALNVGS